MNPLGSTTTPEPSERSRTAPPSPPGPPKNLSKKSPNGFSSSSPGFWPPRRRAAGLIVDSVLMLTTAGSSDLAICENWLDICRGAGTLKGVASDDLFSCPFTPTETTVPIRMPTANVSRITSVDATRLALKRLHKALARTSMLTCLQFSKLLIIPWLRTRKARVDSAFIQLDARDEKSVVESRTRHVKKCQRDAPQSRRGGRLKP